jgi:hypothetical protein
MPEMVLIPSEVETICRNGFLLEDENKVDQLYGVPLLILLGEALFVLSGSSLLDMYRCEEPFCFSRQLAVCRGTLKIER